MSNKNLIQLSNKGVSVWLDDLSRKRLQNGELSRLIAEYCIVGVTTNPSILAASISAGNEYQEQIRFLRSEGLSAEQIVFALASDDVRKACDELMSVYKKTNGSDGRVSIEVSPALAHDVTGTVAQAIELWQSIDRPNLMIKIPATDAGLLAIPQVIAAGISVNVTLIFGLKRYREVINAYHSGLEIAYAAGKNISDIHSVASVFISRFDTLVDEILEKNASAEALSVRSRSGIANAILIFEINTQMNDSQRAKTLTTLGANNQRVLWASTGVKNPNHSQTMYVSELVAANTVNTMPLATLLAVGNQGVSKHEELRLRYREADAVWNQLDAIGVDYDHTVSQLEVDGLDKFDAAWSELLNLISSFGSQASNH